MYCVAPGVGLVAGSTRDGHRISTRGGGRDFIGTKKTLTLKIGTTNSEVLIWGQITERNIVRKTVH